MRSALLSAFCVLAASQAAAERPCPTEPPTADGALAAERAWVAALEHRDTPALLCILDPSFIDSNWQGRLIGRAEMISNVTSRPRPTLNLSQLQVAMHGKVAIVRGLNRQARSGESAAVRFTDVFAYREGAWRAVSAQETVVRQ